MLSDIHLVLAIWVRWLDAKPTETWKTARYKRDDNRTRGAGDGSSSQRHGSASLSEQGRDTGMESEIP